MNISVLLQYIITICLIWKFSICCKNPYGNYVWHSICWNIVYQTYSCQNPIIWNIWIICIMCCETWPYVCTERDTCYLGTQVMVPLRLMKFLFNSTSCYILYECNPILFSVRHPVFCFDMVAEIRHRVGSGHPELPNECWMRRIDHLQQARNCHCHRQCPNKRPSSQH